MTQPPPNSPRQPRRGHGRPTLHDVAGLAAVTRITVSRYLNAPGQVAPETAARICAAIAAIGYVPNLQAGQLASGRSKVVAALIPSINNSIFAETIQALSEGLNNTGYELLLTCTAYDMTREEAQLRALIGWAPAALVMTGRQHSQTTLRLMLAAQLAGTPVIEIWDDRHADEAEPAFARIGFSHAEVGRAMARHLLQQGHRHLAYVHSPIPADFRAQERGDAFAAEAAAAGATLSLFRAGTGDPFDAGRESLIHLLSSQSAVTTVTAVAFSNDNLACGALLEAKRRGIDVPGALSLLGFGDFPIGRQLSPSLSTISPPRGEIGRAAAQALLAALTTNSVTQGVSLPWVLLERDSSARKI